MTERAILPGGPIPAWLERLNRSPEQAGPKGEGFRPGGVLSSPGHQENHMRRILCRIGLHWWDPSPDPTTWQCTHCYAVARHH